MVELVLGGMILLSNLERMPPHWWRFSKESYRNAVLDQRAKSDNTVQKNWRIGASKNGRYNRPNC